MIVFPNAKINLGLRVINKRADGFHNIESFFLPVNLCDVLEVITANDGKTDFTISGIVINDDAKNNLVYKAYLLLAEQYKLPPVKIHLHKVIPTGAGLGGGSADGAFMLKLLNQKFKLSITDEQLEKFAMQMGSDCVFFIKNKISIVEGRGDVVNPIDFDFKNYKIVIAHPSVHISTKNAYSGLKLNATDTGWKEKIRKASVLEWKNFVFNDFEQAAFEQNMTIAHLKEKFYKMGARYAAMTGSGSAVYGVFENEINLNQLPINYFTWQGDVMQ
jgi:4-diphosphocytidyl-2-C-methyl-D-erythritol kinase